MSSLETLHTLPVCAELLDATAAANEIRPDLDAYELLRGTGNLCIGVVVTDGSATSSQLPCPLCR